MPLALTTRLLLPPVKARSFSGSPLTPGAQFLAPKMAVKLLFRVDIGFDEDRGYAAVLNDIPNQRMKGIKGNSPEQLISRIRNVFLEEMRHKRDFPLESERGAPSQIISTEGL